MIVPVASAPRYDVTASFKIPCGNQSAAATSRATLQNSIDDGTLHSHPWFFPAALGGTSQNMPYHINDTLVLPEDTGRQFEGVGRHLGTSDNGTLRTSFLCLRQWTFQTIFDGSTNKLTSSGASAVVTLVGRTVADRNRYNTVHISGGANVVPGWYGIESVDVANNRWTLDRSWCTGAVTDGQGTYKPSIVTDLGAGRVWKSLGFSARQLINDGPEGSPVSGLVNYHLASSYAPDDRRSTGYQHFTDCGFYWADIGILCGRYLNHEDPFDLSKVGSSWIGDSDDQSDNLTTDACFFVGKVAVYANNRLSLIHTHRAMRCSISDSVFFFAAGGKLRADGIEINGETGKQCILTLGRWAYELNVGEFNIQNVSFDGNTANPQLLYGRSQTLTQSPQVTIGHVAVFDKDAATALPRVDIDGSAFIHLHHIGGWASGVGIPAGSLLLRANAAGYRPTVMIDYSLVGDADPGDLLHADSASGARVIFGTGNRLSDGTILEAQTYTK